MKKSLKMFLVLMLTICMSNVLLGADNKILVAYFTYGENTTLPSNVDATASASIQRFNDKVTGNTGMLAHMISNATGGDLFSILTADKYPSNYNATINQGRIENSNKARPRLASHITNLEEYDTIFLGFPNWWYDMPMAIYTFLDEYDLSGKTIIPFNTSGGSGFSNAINSIREAEPNATVLDGLTIGANRAVNAENNVLGWLRELGYAD